jgi:hypothetical protein
MTLRNLLALTVAAATVLSAVGAAQAAFTYTSAPVATLASGSLGGSTVITTAVSSVTPLTLPTFINIADVGLASTTAPPATDTFVLSFNDPITLTNISPPGTAATGVIPVTGTLTFVRSDTGGEVSFFMPGPASSATIGGVVYSISNLSYTPATVNNLNAGAGNISALVSAVPEPASASILILGAVGFLARRRTV